ncbi:MAG: DMT family transporter [Terriglobales bacterium]
MRLRLLLAVLVLAWSLNYIFGKVAIHAFAAATPHPAVAVVGLRGVAAAALLILLQPLLGAHGRLPRLRGSEWGLMLGLGATGITLNQYCFVTGLGRTSVAHAALIVAITPILVLLLAALRRQERVTWGKALGMALSLGGVAALFWKTTGGTATRTGDLIVLAGSAAFAVYTVAGKDVAHRFSSFALNYFIYGLGALLLLPLTLPALLQTRWAAVPWAGWGAVAYMACIGSVLAYVIYFEAMKTLSASAVSALSYLQPVIAALIGALVLTGEAITPGLVLGGTVVLVGVYLTER